MKLKELHQNILELCLHDYTELWLVIVRISQDSYPTNKVSDSVFHTTIKEVREMLESGLFEAGNLKRENGGEVFTAFDLSIDGTIDYIEKEWKKLEGNAPHVGYICWFRATLAGEKLGKKLHLI